MTIHTIKQLYCEICKKVYPEKIKFNGRSIELLDLDKPSDDFFMLELQHEEAASNGRILFVVDFKDRLKLKLGRATDADLKMNDITVSRAHAIFLKEGNNLLVKDLGSKFGTLVKLRHELRIIPFKKLRLQIGKVMIEFSMNPACCQSIMQLRRTKVTYNDLLRNYRVNEDNKDESECSDVSKDEQRSLISEEVGKTRIVVVERDVKKTLSGQMEINEGDKSERSIMDVRRVFSGR